MLRLLVIADDLTGAADTGAKFAGQGVSTRLLVESEGVWPETTNTSQVLVVNSESRHLAPVEASSKVAGIVARGVDLGITHFYKKTDSTLRGNVGAELDAMRVVLGRKQIAFLPAYPALGRTTSGGVQHVCGKPVSQTSFAADPLEPATDSDVSTIIRRQTSTKCRLVNASSSLSSIADDSEAAILIFDAITDNDLLHAGKTLKRHHLLGATAGAAGFAEISTLGYSGSAVPSGRHTASSWSNLYSGRQSQ